MNHQNSSQILAPGDRDALVAYLLAWADDELILGHRDSEWTGFAPQIEEDVAFSSIAQDEMGHAGLLYGLIAELTGDDVDHLALRRPPAEYRHAAMVELPNGDWAFTIARHYLYDLAELCRVDALVDSTYVPLAAIARKVVREEHYHAMHGSAWWERLRDGSSESRARLYDALRDLLPLAADLFVTTPDERALVASGVLPCPAGALYEEWLMQIEPLIEAIDPTLRAHLEVYPAPRMPRPVGDCFLALHAEMTMVSAAGLGERW